MNSRKEKPNDKTDIHSGPTDPHYSYRPQSHRNTRGTAVQSTILGGGRRTHLRRYPVGLKKDTWGINMQFSSETVEDVIRTFEERAGRGMTARDWAFYVMCCENQRSSEGHRYSADDQLLKAQGFPIPEQP